MDTVQQAVSQPIELPKFNQVIDIQVEVQHIYEKLKAEFPNDYKHAELVSHAIIGSGLNNGGLLYIYNALNGFTSAVDFKVGEIIICTEKKRYERYDTVIENKDGTAKVFDEKYVSVAEAIEERAARKPHKPAWETRMVEIGECEIIAVDFYRADKVKVKYLGQSHYNNDGQMVQKEEWVNHKKCTHIPIPEIQQVNI